MKKHPPYPHLYLYTSKFDLRNYFLSKKPLFQCKIIKKQEKSSKYHIFSTFRGYPPSFSKTTLFPDTRYSYIPKPSHSRNYPHASKYLYPPNIPISGIPHSQIPKPTIYLKSSIIMFSDLPNCQILAKSHFTPLKHTHNTEITQKPSKNITSGIPNPANPEISPLAKTPKIRNRVPVPGGEPSRETPLPGGSGDPRGQAPAGRGGREGRRARRPGEPVGVPITFSCIMGEISGVQNPPPGRKF